VVPHANEGGCGRDIAPLTGRMPFGARAIGPRVVGPASRHRRHIND